MVRSEILVQKGVLSMETLDDTAGRISGNQNGLHPGQRVTISLSEKRRCK